jgi:hypothetical protein
MKWDNNLTIFVVGAGLILLLTVLSSIPMLPANAHVCTEEEKAAEICTLDYTPVCGDDGVTYGNACMGCASGNITYHVPGEC